MLELGFRVWSLDFRVLGLGASDTLNRVWGLVLSLNPKPYKAHNPKAETRAALILNWVSQWPVVPSCRFILGSPYSIPRFLRSSLLPRFSLGSSHEYRIVAKRVPLS